MINKLIFILLLSPLSLVAQERCIQDGNFKTICAPFGGTVFQNGNFQVVCAPGQCVVEYGWQVRCSKESGGAAQINQSFQAVCSGGCVEPNRSYCAGELKP